jgi:hypothetical protein
MPDRTGPGRRVFTGLTRPGDETMRKLTAALCAVACAVLAALMSGCTCECEVECTGQSGTPYSQSMTKMKRSECEDLNRVGSDSCQYRCSDR